MSLISGDSCHLSILESFKATYKEVRRAAQMTMRQLAMEGIAVQPPKLEAVIPVPVEEDIVKL